MDFAFILDPLPELKAYKDTSVAMLRALAKRGHRIFAGEQRHLVWEDGVTRMRAVPLELEDDDHDWYKAGDVEERQLEDYAAVLMRKDPPFDMEYVYSTYLLEAAEARGARVYNRPRATARSAKRWPARYGRRACSSSGSTSSALISRR